jgi:hypothetical protein
MQLGVGISKRGYKYLGKGLNTLKVKGIGIEFKIDSKNDSKIDSKNDTKIDSKNDSKLHSKKDPRLHSKFYNMPKFYIFFSINSLKITYFL